MSLFIPTSIEEHWLKGVTRIITPNRGGVFTADQPDTLVLHYTAHHSPEVAIKSLCDPSSKASAHLVISNEGALTQLAPFNQKTWHAGKSQWKTKIGLNQYSIGIEITNPGFLTKTQNGFLTWYNRPVALENVIEATHRNEQTPRYWHRYTEQQIEIVEEVCRLLIQTYSIKEILGHEEIAPGRKTDPGPAFPLDKLRERLLGPGRDED